MTTNWSVIFSIKIIFFFRWYLFDGKGCRDCCIRKMYSWRHRYHWKTRHSVRTGREKNHDNNKISILVFFFLNECLAGTLAQVLWKIVIWVSTHMILHVWFIVVHYMLGSVLSRHLNFMCTGMPKPHLTVCKCTCAIEPARHNHSEKPLMCRFCIVSWCLFWWLVILIAVRSQDIMCCWKKTITWRIYGDWHHVKRSSKFFGK